MVLLLPHNSKFYLQKWHIPRFLLKRFHNPRKVDSPTSREHILSLVNNLGEGLSHLSNTISLAYFASV